MAVPQLPYESDSALRPPGDPGPFMGTLAEVPGVVGDAVGAYRDAEQGLARTLNSGIPLINPFPVPPEGQGSFLPGSAVPPPSPAAAPGAPVTPAGQPPMDLSFLTGGSGGGLGASVANTVGSDVSRTRQVQTAGEKQAVAGLNENFAQREGLEGRRSALATEKATDLQGQILRENTALDDAQKQATEQRVRMDAAVTQADAYLKQRRDAFSKDGVRSFYADSPKGTASLIASALFTGLGAWAQALGGGPNTAWMILKDATDKWENRERLRLDQQRDLIAGAERDVGRMEQRKTNGEIEIKNNRLALLESFERQRMANAAKYGVREEALASDATLLNIRQEKAKTQFEIQKSLREQVVSSNATQQAVRLATAKAQGEAGGPAKDFQAKANTALIVAVPEVKRLQKLPPYSGKDEGVIANWRRQIGTIKDTSVDGFLNTVSALSGDVVAQLSPQAQRRFAAETTYAEAVLREKSGASISPTEYHKQLFPVQIFATDTPEVAREKAERRQTALAGIAAKSNRASDWMRELGYDHAAGQPQQADQGKPNRADLEALSWARKNPNDPRSAQILEQLKGRSAVRP